MTEVLEFTIVVPVFNEADHIAELVAEIADVLRGRAFEIIVVDDSSNDDTPNALAAAKAQHPELRIFRHRKNAGQSRAIRTGVLNAKGRIIGTLDGDGQNDPADLPQLYRRLTRPDASSDLGLVMGERVDRRDTMWKKLGSAMGNFFRRRFLGDEARDSACGAKVFSRDAFLALPYFDHMHRYMPALMSAEGFEVEFAAVNHRPRRSGVSKYGNMDRLWAGVSDLSGVRWLMRRRRSPGGADEL